VSSYRTHRSERVDDVLAPVRCWTARKKCRLMLAIQNGDVSFEQARVAHALSTDELEHWWRTYRQRGIKGLQAAELVR
jgi:hypothetical protein